MIDRTAVGTHLTHCRAETCWLTHVFLKRTTIPFACLSDPCLENMPGETRVNPGELSQDSWKIQLCRATVCGVALRWVPEQRAPSLRRQAAVYFWHCIRVRQDLPTSTLKDNSFILFSCFCNFLNISITRGKWMTWLVGDYLPNLFFFFFYWNSLVFRIH